MPRITVITADTKGSRRRKAGRVAAINGAARLKMSFPLMKRTAKSTGWIMKTANLYLYTDRKKVKKVVEI